MPTSMLLTSSMPKTWELDNNLIYCLGIGKTPPSFPMIRYHHPACLFGVR